MLQHEVGIPEVENKNKSEVVEGGAEFGFLGLHRPVCRLLMRTYIQILTLAKGGQYGYTFRRFVLRFNDDDDGMQIIDAEINRQETNVIE